MNCSWRPRLEGEPHAELKAAWLVIADWLGEDRTTPAALDNITGAWISEQKVDFAKGKIRAYRVNMKVTFVLKG